MTAPALCRAEGDGCHFELGHCPLHGVSVAAAPPPIPDDTLRDLYGPPAEEMADDGGPVEFSAADLAEHVAKGLIFGQLPPSMGFRLLRAVESLHRIGPSERAGKAVSEMAFVRGLLVNGLPPVTRRDWEWARKLLEPGTFEYLRHWDPRVPWEENDAKDYFTTPTYAKHGVQFGPRYWGDRAIDMKKYPAPPDHEVPEFFNPYLPEYEALRARRPDEPKRGS